VLSFGPQTPPLNLCSLNVLIGPNGSGKSNLLEVLSLLRSTPVDCRPVILKGGGIAEWIWKGEPHGVASVNAVVSYPSGKQSLRHLFEFRAANQSFQIAREGIENERAHEVRGDPSLYYQLLGGQAVINGAGAAPRQLSPDKIIRNSRSWRSGGPGHLPRNHAPRRSL